MTVRFYKASYFDTNDPYISQIVDSNSDTKADGKANDTFVVSGSNNLTFFRKDCIIKGVTPAGATAYYRYKGTYELTGASSTTVTFKDSPTHSSNQIESIYSGAGALASTYWDVITVFDRNPDIGDRYEEDFAQTQDVSLGGTYYIEDTGSPETTFVIEFSDLSPGNMAILKTFFAIMRRGTAFTYVDQDGTAWTNCYLKTNAVATRSKGNSNYATYDMSFELRRFSDR